MWKNKAMDKTEITISKFNTFLLEISPVNAPFFIYFLGLCQLVR